ncbi:MAG: GNAT family N-acetyltransferase [Pirellulales bacterium]|nr:GNAT family N-acetyltransferase [Pirellulales bacterium]
MQVVLVSNIDELAPLAESWDRLAGQVPFRGWTWNATWWRHYGPTPGDRRRLYVLALLDRRDRLIGLAPWYLDHSRAGRRVVRFLGAGELHPDYLGVLCQPGRERDVAVELARWLLAHRDDPDEDASARWDQLELTGIDASDPVMPRLAARLDAQGNALHQRPGPTCWRIALPATTEQYVASLSHNSRKKFRRIERRMFDSGRAELRLVASAGELSAALDALIDLHQRRRAALGQPGCFSSSRFAAFHRDVAGRMLSTGQLLLHVLEIDKRPAAVEYGFAGGGIVYGYQGGIDATRLDLEPGRVAMTGVLRWAIANGYRAYDLMRGNEPYKSHWRPEPRASIEIRVIAPHAAARLRHAAWLVAAGAREWIKWGMGE